MVSQWPAAWALFTVVLGLGIQGPVPPADTPPSFGRDTVLVYRSSNEAEGAFVVRIAQFLPDRYFEWEDGTTQGTIFLPGKVMSDAHALVNYQLFQGGVDTRAKNASTLWLSRRIYREMKQSPKVKFDLDGIPTTVKLVGLDRMTIDVNRTPQALPVIKTLDERGAERWFLDIEDNTLLVNLLVRQYQQKLTSITTDRPNTLRWIKKH